MRVAAWTLGVVVGAGLIVLGTASETGWLIVLGIVALIGVGTWPLEVRRRKLWRSVLGSDRKKARADRDSAP